MSYQQYVYVLGFMYQTEGNCIIPTVCLYSRLYVSERGKIHHTVCSWTILCIMCLLWTYSKKIWTTVFLLELEKLRTLYNILFVWGRIYTGSYENKPKEASAILRFHVHVTSLVIMFIKDIKYTAKSVSSIDLHLYIDNQYWS